MREIRFSSKEHKHFFYAMLAKSGNMDVCHQAFFYAIGISPDTRRSIHRVFDINHDCINFDSLHEGWQTGESIRVTRLAFNLWNGYTQEGKEALSTPYELFDCGYAPYFFEAVRLRYPEYCREIDSVREHETCR